MTDETETLDQALARFDRFQKPAVRQRLPPLLPALPPGSPGQPAPL